MEELFETMAGSESEETYQSLVRSSAPIFANILSAPSTQDNMGIQAEACELVGHILDGRAGDVGAELGPAVWKPMFDCAMNTDDHATVQVNCSLQECGVYMLNSAFGKVCVRYLDQVHQEGCQRIVTMVSRSLDISVTFTLNQILPQARWARAIWSGTNAPTVG
jgi:hypothetical protein